MRKLRKILLSLLLITSFASCTVIYADDTDEFYVVYDEESNIADDVVDDIINDIDDRWDYDDDASEEAFIYISTKDLNGWQKSPWGISTEHSFTVKKKNLKNNEYNIQTDDGLGYLGFYSPIYNYHTYYKDDHTYYDVSTLIKHMSWKTTGNDAVKKVTFYPILYSNPDYQGQDIGIIITLKKRAKVGKTKLYITYSTSEFGSVTATYKIKIK